MAFREREVTGVVIDGDGTPVTNGVIKFKPTLPLGYTNSHIIIDREFTAETNTDGEFSATLWCDEDSLVAIDYKVAFPVSNGGQPDADHVASFSLQYSDGSPINLAEVINTSIPAPTPEDLLYTLIQELIAEAGGGGGVWGSITGTLSDQTDLQTVLNAKAIATRAINTGTGLTGGGNLTADRTLALDINGLTAESVADDADYIAIYSDAASAIRRMLRADFLAGIGASSPLVLTANNASEVPLTLKMAASQTANVLELKDSLDALVFRVTKDGYLFASGSNASLQLSEGAARALLQYGFNWVMIQSGSIDFSISSGNGFTVDSGALFPATSNATDLGKTGNLFKNVYAKYYIPQTSTNAAAPNNSIYYSSDNSKLVYKDSGGTVNNLY
jgi:hypothetical protein